METTEQKSQDVPVHNKQELSGGAERTFAGKAFSPSTDVFETERELVLHLDMPGVLKEGVEINLDQDRLEIAGRLPERTYTAKDVVYSEYNVGHFYRRFTLSNKIAKDKIVAHMNQGVLVLTLPKVLEAAPRRIQVQ